MAAASVPSYFGYNGSPIRDEDLSKEELAALTSAKTGSEKEVLNAGRAKAIRTERYKLTVMPGDVDELYDLEQDPDELTNVAEHPDYRTRRLTEELLVTQHEVMPERIVSY